ncbi:MULTISPECIES: DUF58 domain-containing protein [Bifidobacterium]|uniref:DUF58 domain-containing protein n=1 Tax=Bifidobacterium TaxID=1678 RepID=UPI0018DB00C7|nr:MULTISPECIES: DUF58 domain-containing protein [Bifidobacterium]MBI0144752.1 DUF58 domain-containing protein [Bifidobacterium polysaccharolyticum]MBI0151574.1 DUF58 domain-containing protein [Bifidobacterium sp. M0399]
MTAFARRPAPDARPASSAESRQGIRAQTADLWQSVTALGWAMALAALVCALAFVPTGWRELLAGVLLGVGMLLLGLLMSLGNLSCSAETSLNQGHLEVGGQAELVLVLTNPGNRSTRRGRIGLTLGQAAVMAPLPALAPGQNHQIRLKLEARSRGVIDLGPVTMEAGDPLGLIRRRRILAGARKLYIHPRTVALPPLEAGLERDLEGDPGPGIVDDDLEFHALRPYAPGDDMKRVHWLSTARAGTLMVRQYEPTLRTRTELILDGQAASYRNADEFELAVEIYASLGCRCLLDGRRLQARAPEPDDSDAHGTTLPTEDPRSFLDACSAIHPRQGGYDSLDRTDASEQTSLTILVTGSMGDRQPSALMGESAQSASSVMLLAADLDAHPSLQAQPGLVNAVLGSIRDLPILLENQP